MRMENGSINDIDVTEITNNTMPKVWYCPHCYNRIKSRLQSNEILLEFGKVVEQCGRCGHLHIFRLNLTDDFKEKVVDFLKKYSGV